jgi:hypothetical protein
MNTETQTMAIMAELAYAAIKKKEDTNLSQDRINMAKSEAAKRFPDLNLNDWEIIKSNQDMFATKNQRTNDIIMACRGSSKHFWLRDFLINDLQIFFGLMPNRVFQSEKFAKEVISKNPESKIWFTGHSLGGTVAEYLGLFHPSAKCETFNRGWGEEHGDAEYSFIKFPKQSNITSHHIPGDMISSSKGFGNTKEWKAVIPENPHALKNFTKSFETVNNPGNN